MTEMRPQENNVWGTGSLRAWYKGEHHEAKIAREGACLPRKAGHAWYLQIPATLGTYGYLWVLTVPVIGYLWVLMGTHGTLIVYSPRTLRVPPGTQGYSAGTQGNSLRASCLEDESVVLVRAPAARLQKCMLKRFQIGQYQDLG